MALITWSTQLSVGVTEIDTQHKKLIDIINRLADAMKAGQGREVCATILNELIQYTQFHFGTEEKLMTKHAYPGGTAHNGEHKQLIDKVLHLQKETSKLSITVETMNFLRDWLNHHILEVDKKLGAHLNAQGVH